MKQIQKVGILLMLLVATLFGVFGSSNSVFADVTFSASDFTSTLSDPKVKNLLDICSAQAKTPELALPRRFQMLATQNLLNEAGTDNVDLRCRDIFDFTKIVGAPSPITQAYLDAGDSRVLADDADAWKTISLRQTITKVIRQRGADLTTSAQISSWLKSTAILSVSNICKNLYGDRGWFKGSALGDINVEQSSLISRACNSAGNTAAAQQVTTGADACNVDISNPAGVIGCLLKGFVNFFAQGAIGFVSTIFGFLFFLLATVLNFFVQLLGYIANELLLINPASNQYIDVSRRVFGLFSNLVNLVILFLFIKTGLSFIFDDKKSPDLSQFILTVATIAIGVQFSFAIAAAIIALSYNIGYIFLQTIDPGSVNPFLSFTNAVEAGFSTDPLKYVATISGYFLKIFTGGAAESIGGLIGIAAVQFSRVIILLFTVYMLLKFVIKFATRAATMFFLLISAPIGFVFLIAQDLDPDIKKFGNEWWSGLINNAITYPIIVIGLGIGARLVTQLQALNAGQPLTVDGLDLFEPATYVVIIAPLIRAILPAAIALGTLALLDQWIEENLKPAAGGLTSRIMKGVSSGMLSATKAGRLATNVAGRGLGGAGSLADNFTSRLGAGGVTAGISQFLRMKKGTSFKDRLDEARKVRLAVGIKKKDAARKMGFRSVMSQTLKDSIKGGDLLSNRLYSSDGDLNAMNIFSPYKFVDPKTGKFGFYQNQNSLANRAYVATAQAAKEENDVLVDRSLRNGVELFGQQFAVSNLLGETGLGYTESIADKNKLQSPFDALNGAELKQKEEEQPGSVNSTYNSITRRKGQLAAAEKLYGGKKGLPPVNTGVEILSSKFDFSGLDFNDPADTEKITQRFDKIYSTLSSREQLLMQDVLDDPKKYGKAIAADENLFRMFQSEGGVQGMLKNFDSNDDAERLTNFYSKETGFIGFSERSLDSITRNGGAFLANSIRGDIRAAIQDPTKLNQTALRNANTVGTLLNGMYRDLALDERGLKARTSGNLGLGFTTIQNMNFTRSAMVARSEAVTAQISSVRERFQNDPEFAKFVNANGGIDSVVNSVSDAKQQMVFKNDEIAAALGQNSWVSKIAQKDARDLALNGQTFYSEVDGLENSLKAQIRSDMGLEGYVLDPTTGKPQLDVTGQPVLSTSNDFQRAKASVGGTVIAKQVTSSIIPMMQDIATSLSLTNKPTDSDIERVSNGTSPEAIVEGYKKVMKDSGRSDLAARLETDWKDSTKSAAIWGEVAEFIKKTDNGQILATAQDKNTTFTSTLDGTTAPKSAADVFTYSLLGDTAIQAAAKNTAAELTRDKGLASTANSDLRENQIKAGIEPKDQVEPFDEAKFSEASSQAEANFTFMTGTDTQGRPLNETRRNKNQGGSQGKNPRSNNPQGSPSGSGNPQGNPTPGNSQNPTDQRNSNPASTPFRFSTSNESQPVTFITEPTNISGKQPATDKDSTPANDQPTEPVDPNKPI